MEPNWSERARIAPIERIGLDLTLAPAAASRFMTPSRLATTAGSAIGRIVSSVRESGNTPCLSIRPSLVLNPTMPQKLDGARIEPPVSLPMAQGARPPDTAPAAHD